MASSTYGNIVIRAADRDGGVTRQEALAGEANITPGELLEHTTGGAVLRHNTANGAVTPRLVCLETQTPDSELSSSIDVDYDNGDTLYMAVAQAGDRLYMWLAAGENAAINNLLQSDGDGALVVSAAVDATIITESLVGRAVAAVDNSAGVSPVRIIVEAL